VMGVWQCTQEHTIAAYCDVYAVNELSLAHASLASQCHAWSYSKHAVNTASACLF
jgi:hypothetical protein